MTQDTGNNASRKRPALHHDHHENHHHFGSSKHNHSAVAGHEDHDGIDFQTDHHHHHNVNDQYDQHQHQHQHHMDDDRSQQSESNDHHCLDEEPNEDNHETICPPTHATQTSDQLALPSQDDDVDNEVHVDNDNDNDNGNDPEWDLIAQHGPASQDVPLFLAARERRHEAEQRFERSLDAAHSNLKELMDGLVDVAANVVSERRMRLDSLEAGIQQEFVENDNARADMSKKLEDFAASAQAQFQQLMNRLANANTNANGNCNGRVDVGCID